MITTRNPLQKNLFGFAPIVTRAAAGCGGLRRAAAGCGGLRRAAAGCGEYAQATFVLGRLH